MKANIGSAGVMQSTPNGEVGLAKITNPNAVKGQPSQEKRSTHLIPNPTRNDQLTDSSNGRY